MGCRLKKNKNLYEVVDETGKLVAKGTVKEMARANAAKRNRKKLKETA